MPTKASLSLPFATGKGREKVAKGLGVKIRIGESLSSNYHYGQNRLSLGKLLNL